ncbi:MAG: hypothetical protein ACLU4R_06655 [Lachnospiraceae bacterium]
MAVSRYFLSNMVQTPGLAKGYAKQRGFHGEYTVTGILEGYKEKEVNGCSILLSKKL